jgi:hypothetical protein
VATNKCWNSIHNFAIFMSSGFTATVAMHTFWKNGFDSHVLGQQPLFSLQRLELIHPLYLHNSSFWRVRDALDGVNLSFSSDDGTLSAKLCINTVSTSADTFPTSALFALHRDSLCDPQALERHAQAFIVDGNANGWTRTRFWRS